MKTKILSIAAAATTIALMMAACNPLDEVYAELDKAQEPYHEDIAYTLTDADYAAASTAALKLATNKADSTAAKRIKEELAFNSVYGPEELVPAQLAATYKALNKKSTAQVTYNHNLENTAYLEAIKDSLKSHTYTVTDADYTAIGGSVANVGYFIPSTPAIEFIPNILKAQYPSATKGDYAFVNYKQSNLEPASGPVAKTTTLFLEDWESFNENDSVRIKNNWLTYIPDSAPTGKESYWRIYLRDNNKYAQFNANNYGGTVESWIITPQVIIPTGCDAASLSFDVKAGYFNTICLGVKVSNDFDGSNAATATWVDITSIFTLPTPSKWGDSHEPAGTADLAAYIGQGISVAFVYKGDTESNPKATTAYQIDNIKITATTSSRSGAKADLFEQRNDVYCYNGTKWEQANKFMAVQPADKDRVSSTDKAKTYLPMLLANNYLYALEGDTAIAVYKSDDKGNLAATKWTMTNGQWGEASTIEQRTIQFIHNGQFWLFDPAVNYTMVKDDYQLMVDYIRDHAEHSIFYDKNYKNAEYYYGFAAYYQNLSFRIKGYRDPYFKDKADEQPATLDPELSALNSLEEKVALLWKRSEEGMRIFLELRFRDAVPEVSGVEVYYHVQVNVYGSDGDIAPAVPYIYTYRCTGPATFEFVERKQVE